MAEQVVDNRVTEVPSEEKIAALIKKHRVEIDRILPMSSAEQQAEIAKYDLKPEMLTEHYKYLQDKAVELRRKAASANTASAVTGWGTLAATLGALLIWRKKMSNALIRWAAIVITPVVAGFGGAWLGEKMFGNEARKEGRELANEARTAFERELAIAIENKERFNVAQKLDGAPKTELVTAEGLPVTKDGIILSKDGLAASVPRTNMPAPRESFMAEAAKEKAANQGAEAQR